MLVLGGCLVLFMLCLNPMWNCVSLLNDFNYVFWTGRGVPHNVLIVLGLFVPLFAAVSIIFFASTRSQVLTEQTIMLVATTFITLFGLSLLVTSHFITQQSDVTVTNLLYNCKYSEQTHRLYEYSQVLQNIRATPACASKFSVTECAGYKDSPPYTTFLKDMEDSLKCAGFCYHSSWGTPITSLLAEDARTKQAQRDREASSISASARSHARSGKTYPPTLFSDANYQASCESMAARDMSNYAGDIGWNMYYQGLALVTVAVATGFLRLPGFCRQPLLPDSK